MSKKFIITGTRLFDTNTGKWIRAVNSSLDSSNENNARGGYFNNPQEFEVKSIAQKTNRDIKIISIDKI